jgi:Protein of unknown function (DUF2630)
MDDAGIHNHIEELVAEEHRLLELAGQSAGLDTEQHARLEAVRVELDRYWDLLRQRRAREEFGQDPNTAQLRPADTVEHYEQ